MDSNIHSNQPVIRAGTEFSDADLVALLLHGRGSSAESLLPLVQALSIENTSFLIPQAGLNRWYPQSAFSPVESNEPDLSSALGVIDRLVNETVSSGLSYQQVVLGGFSQGACLASEYAVRNARKYGGLFVLSGALIGPKDTPRNYQGSFDSMPVFIGSSDIDPWVSHDLVSDTASLFENMGANVDFRTYPGMAHTVNQDEIEAVQTLLASAIPS
ncbi:MAG: alpha/beta hydrolase [Anaerolineales bacterium]